MIPTVRAKRYKRWRSKHPLACMLNRIRSKAKAAGIPFDLNVEDIQIPEKCPILGIPLVWEPFGAWRPDKPSLDKVIPTIGYVRGNVRIISSKANLMKQDMTLEQAEAIVSYLKEFPS